MKYERRPAFLTYHSAEFQGLFRGWVHVLTKVQHQNQGFPLTVAGSDAMATAEIALSQEFSKEKLSWESPFPSQTPYLEGQFTLLS